jgi:hypothetical protein
MSEATTRNRIARMWAEINGVQTPFTEIPRALQQAQLPASVIFPGRATHDTKSLGEQMILETRTYKMVLYICEAAFGTTGQTEVQADPFFDAVLQHFTARPGLELDSEGAQQSESVLEAELPIDNGLQVGPYPIAGGDSPNYVQIQWDLQVQEVIAITYKD